MKYDELDERTKLRVKDRWQTSELGYDWWESTYEDAVVTARKLGIEISTTHQSNGQRAWTTTDISFSGFWSQGDGCCFSGTLRVAEMFEATKDMAEHAPQDEALMRLAGVAESIYGMIAAEQMKNRLTDDDTNRDYPDCEVGMSIQIEGKERSYSTKVDDNDIPMEIAKECNEFVGHFADWIYTQLENEHDYLTSDDAFAEWVKDNDPDFDEDGNF